MGTIATSQPGVRIWSRLAFWKRRRVARPPHVSFAELTHAHHLRERALRDDSASTRPYSGDEQKLYRQFREGFEAENGEIVDAYWCERIPSAAALTAKVVTRNRLNPWKHGDAIRIHRVSDWATKEAPEFAGMLHECDALAVKAREILGGTPLRVVMQWIFTVVSYLLGVVDNEAKPGRDETKKVVQAFKQEYTRLEACYRKAAARAAQIVYVQGMVLGLAALGILAAVAGPFVDYEPKSVLFGAYAAGAAGAFVSVLARMTSARFEIDYEVGRSPIFTLGSFRPVIGAVFGVIAYLAVKGGLISISPPAEVHHDAFYLVIAFLGGFSERLFQDMLGGVASRFTAPKEAGASPDISGATVSKH